MQCPSSSWKPLSNLSIQTQNLDISAWYIANANFGGCHIFAFFMLFYSHFQLINNKLGGAGRGGAGLNQCRTGATCWLTRMRICPHCLPTRVSLFTS